MGIALLVLTGVDEKKAKRAYVGRFPQTGRKTINNYWRERGPFPDFAIKRLEAEFDEKKFLALAENCRLRKEEAGKVIEHFRSRKSIH